MKKSHYEGHMRSHDSERPFRCPTCGKGYKERKHCREHVRRLHPNDFNLVTLFASITSEDAHVADMLCSEQAVTATHMQSPNDQHSSSLQNNSDQLQSAAALHSGFMLGEQSATGVNQTTLMVNASTVPSPGLHLFPAIALSNLDPILQEIGQIHSQPTQFLMSAENERQGLTATESVEHNMQCETVVPNTVTLAVLSNGDTSVLSQGLES
jgi:hypothetical protein